MLRASNIRIVVLSGGMMGTQHQSLWLETEQEEVEAEWNDPQRRLQHQVEMQSRQIEQLLARNDLQAGVRGGSIRPHWVSFDLATQLSGGWERLRRLTGDLATALGVPEVRVERQQGKLRLAVRRYEPHPVDLLDLLEMLPEAGDLFLPLGLDHQGQPVILDLAEPDLHNVLIAGISGAGKSSLMRCLAISLALTCRQSQAQMAVISLGSEPSGITARPNPLYPINYLPHMLFPLANTVDDAVEALEYLVEEITYRADNSISSPALVIMVDDADMLLRRVGGGVAQHLAALLHAPAEAGVKVIVGASNPGLPDLYRMLQHNIDYRLVGRMADERSASAAAGREKTYAQYLDGKGDFLAISAQDVTPFQAAFIDDYDLHLTLTELHRASDPILLAQALEPGASLPPSWSTAESHSFSFDGNSARVEPQPERRAGFEAIEIVVDGDGEPDADGDGLSWLDESGQQAGESSAVAQAAEEPRHSPAADNRPDAEAVSADDEDEPPDGDLPPARLMGPPENAAPENAAPTRYYSPWLSPDSKGQAPPIEAGELDEGPTAGDILAENEPVTRGQRDTGARQRQQDEFESSKDAGGSYEMLPFEDFDYEAGGSLPALEEGQPPSTAEVDSAIKPATRQNGLSKAMSKPASNRAQALWPLEPTYTDIDDDLWDAPDGDDDDDWRNRLH